MSLTLSRHRFNSVQLAIDRTLPTSWKHIIQKPSLRKRALITMGTTGFIQCSGILVVNNYGTL
jgi:hypothetical protein